MATAKKTHAHRETRMLIGLSMVALAFAAFYLGMYAYSIGFRVTHNPSISDITPMYISQNSAVISFLTDRPTAGYAYYATDPSFSDMQYFGGSYVRPYHNVQLSNLKSGTTYYYYVVADPGDRSDATKSATMMFTTPQASAIAK